jgi:hypothetical protein
MKVARGFKLVYIGLLIVVIAIVGAFFTAIIAGMAVAGGAGAGAGLGLVGGIIIGLFLLAFAGNITGLIGRIFCISIPERAGQAKQFIIISIVLEVISMVLAGFSQLGGVAHLNINPILMQVLPLAQVVCVFSSEVFFLLFTKAVAQYIRQSDLADSAMSVLKMFVMSIACYILGILLTVGLGLAGAVGGGGVRGAAGGFMLGACLGVIVMLVGLVIAIIALIRFIVLMKEMNEAVARYARIQRRKQREKRESERKRRESEDEEDEDEEEEEEEDEDDDDRPRRRRGREKWSD